MSNGSSQRCSEDRQALSLSLGNDLGVEREDGEAKGPAFLPPRPQADTPKPHPRLFASPSPWKGAGKGARASAHQLVRADGNCLGILPAS